MSESWIRTRAEIARTKKKNPDADVTELREKLREQVAAAKVRQLAENLNHEQRLRVASILTEPNKESGSDQ